MTRRETLLALADRVEQGQGGDRHLNAEVMTVLGYVVRDTRVMDPRGATCFSIPDFLTSWDAARTVSNWVLLGASDIGADGLPLVELGNPATVPTGLVHGIAYGGGPNPIVRAYLAAALRAQAMEA